MVSISLAKIHLTNKGIKENKTFSINILSCDYMVEVDYVGIVSGTKVDKSGVFTSFFGELKTAPIIEESMLAMECVLRDIYDTGTHEVMIGEIAASYASDKALTGDKIDMSMVSPLLFDKLSMRYWSLGSPVRKCWNEGKKFRAS
jgi:flavin reductase (DIM6/NTAB) family NADH-FMN oxidoreductase RutF